MKKSCVLVGIMVAGALYASEARAQHKAPNQQPPQATEATAPAGDTTLGSVRLPKGVTADGKPLPAGTYTVRLTTQEVGSCCGRCHGVARALGRIRPGWKRQGS